VYPHQLERLTIALGRHALEAVVASAPANLLYLAGRPVTPGARERPALAVMAPAGLALVVAVEDAAVAERAAGIDHVVPYRRNGLGAAVTAALAALDVDAGAVGLDTGGLTSAQARSVAAALGARGAMEASGVLLHARQVKGPWEIETIDRALLAGEHGLNAVVQRLEAGTTEREATAIFEAEVRRHGAEPRVSRITFGEGTVNPTGVPTARRLRAGDLVRLDVGCTAAGYHADVARTGVMGEARDRESSVVDTLAQGIDAAISAMHAGVRVSLVVEAALEAIRAGGLPGYEPSAIGHGIGLEVREPPILEATSEAVLEAEMVLVVDLSHVEPGLGGARLTETVLVSRRSARSMNRSQRGLLVL
jgi:Xaa-Pro aminopeptidase